jgi:hypothetical protein
MRITASTIWTPRSQNGRCKGKRIGVGENVGPWGRMGVTESEAVEPMAKSWFRAPKLQGVSRWLLIPGSRLKPHKHQDNASRFE